MKIINIGNQTQIFFLKFAMNNPEAEPRGIWVKLATDCTDSRR